MVEVLDLLCPITSIITALVNYTLGTISMVTDVFYTKAVIIYIYIYISPNLLYDNLSYNLITAKPQFSNL